MIVTSRINDDVLALQPAGFEILRLHAADGRQRLELMRHMPRLEDDAARKQWVDQLQRWTTNTFVSNTNYLAGFSLACVASNTTVAQAIYDEANAYLSLPPAMHLVPRAEVVVGRFHQAGSE